MIPTIYTQIKGHISIYSYCRLMFFLAIWNHARFTDGWHCPQNHLSYADCVDYTLVVTFLFWLTCFVFSCFHPESSPNISMMMLMTITMLLLWCNQTIFHETSPIIHHEGVKTKMLRAKGRNVWTMLSVI